MQLSLFGQEESVKCNTHKDSRECPNCNRVLHRSKFTPSAFEIEKRHHGRGTARWCKECANTYRKTLAGLKAIHKYPTVEICECCLKPPKYGNLILDHCHKTGAFRGWLCKSCNSGIGGLGDNLDGVKKAIAYLEKAEYEQP